jgi:hypothetical protein
MRRKAGFIVVIMAWMTGYCVSAVPPAGNLLINADFDEADGNAPRNWEYFTNLKPALSMTNVMNTQCIQLQSQEKPGAFQGIIQRVAVQSGEKYAVSASIKNSREQPLGGSAFGQIVVEWMDEKNREVGRTWSDQCGSSVSKIRWDQVVISKVAAPKEAVAARIGFHLYDGDRGGKGALLVDNIALTQQ